MGVSFLSECTLFVSAYLRNYLSDDLQILHTTPLAGLDVSYSKKLYFDLLLVIWSNLMP